MKKTLLSNMKIMLLHAREVLGLGDPILAKGGGRNHEKT
jgi:hypothetical protein